MRFGKHSAFVLASAMATNLLVTTALLSTTAAISADKAPILVVKKKAIGDEEPVERTCQVSVYLTRTRVTGRLPSSTDSQETLDKFALGLVKNAVWGANPVSGTLAEGQSFGYQGNGNIASYLAIKSIGDGCGKTLQLISPSGAAIALGQTTTTSGATVRIFGLVSAFLTYNDIVSINTTLWFDWGSSILD